MERTFLNCYDLSGYAWSPVSHKRPCATCVYGGADGVCHRSHHRQSRPNAACGLYRYRGGSVEADVRKGPDAEGPRNRAQRHIGDCDLPVCLVDIMTGRVVARWDDSRYAADDMHMCAGEVRKVCAAHRILNRSRYTFRFEREYDAGERFASRAPIMQLSADGELEAVYPCVPAIAEHTGMSVKAAEKAVSFGRALDGTRFERMSEMGQANLSEDEIAPFLVGWRETDLAACGAAV